MSSLRQRFSKDGRLSPGPPPIIAALLVVELLVIGGLLAFDVSVGGILRWTGPLMALTLALLNPRVQELGRRQAKLSVRADQANKDGVILAASLPPWPIDARRVLANELADARQTLNWPDTTSLYRFTDPFARMPTDADRAQSRSAFEEQVTEFEASLEDWLGEYLRAASEYSCCFELTLQVANAPSGAHADGVIVALELPSAVKVVEHRPEIGEPPARPRYEPPLPRSPMRERLYSGPLDAMAPLVLTTATPKAPVPVRLWKSMEGQRRLEAPVGEVHAARSVKVGEPLLLLVDGPGEYLVNWAAYTRSARRAARGAVTLVAPVPEGGRPAFGRLDGIVSYPDVPIVDEEGEVVHSVRVADPPLHPPATDGSGDVLAVLQGAVSFREWNALGLDPSADGPEASEVVRAARPMIQRAGESSAS